MEAFRSAALMSTPLASDPGTKGRAHQITSSRQPSCSSERNWGLVVCLLGACFWKRPFSASCGCRHGDSGMWGTEAFPKGRLSGFSGAYHTRWKVEQDLLFKVFPALIKTEKTWERVETKTRLFTLQHLKWQSGGACVVGNSQTLLNTQWPKINSKSNI